jgi:hypothetical protein
VNGQLHGPAALNPGKAPQYPLDRRLGEPRAVLMTWRRDNASPYQDMNSDSSAVHPVVSRYTKF